MRFNNFFLLDQQAVYKTYISKPIQLDLWEIIAYYLLFTVPIICCVIFIKSKGSTLEPPDEHCFNKKYHEDKNNCKYEKIKLHIKYIMGISCAGFILLLSEAVFDSTSIGSKLAFASTLTSIVLSVLAIILSMWGETRSANINSQVESSVQALNQTSHSFNEKISDFNEKVNGFANTIDNFQQGVNKISSDILNMSNRVDSIFDRLNVLEIHISKLEEKNINKEKWKINFGDIKSD